MNEAVAAVEAQVRTEMAATAAAFQCRATEITAAMEREAADIRKSREARPFLKRPGVLHIDEDIASAEDPFVQRRGKHHARMHWWRYNPEAACFVLAPDACPSSAKHHALIVICPEGWFYFNRAGHC